MPYMEWDESFAVGVAEIDEQHKRLFKLVDALQDACASECATDVLMDAVDEFCEYTRHHFATEERYMDSFQYQGQGAHMEEHMMCSMRAVEFFGRCVAGDDALRGEFLAFLKDWLVTHIKGTDKGLGAYLNKRGVA